jgi:hypothetical protein
VGAGVVTVFKSHLVLPNEGDREMSELDSSSETGDPRGYPEDYLWVRLPDKRLTVISGDRLCELYYAAATPENPTEELLVQNREWLRVYVQHCVGMQPITIPPGGPLPEWDARWLASAE